MIFRSILLVAFTLLCACADPGFIPYVSETPSTARQIKVMTISTREMDPSGALTGKRSEHAHYIRNVVSIPPGHRPGAIEKPYQNPDPNRHFVISDYTPLRDDAAFVSELRRDLNALPRKEREIMLFVHGYNTSYSYAVFRAAQLQHDFKVPGLMLNYSWPSAANPLGYSHDRDSVLYTRDNLQKTLKLIRAKTSAPILLVGHSMGGLLVMETLRQIEIETPGWSKSALSGVMLVAPDISVDVFHKQASRFGGLPQPFAIFSSRKDPALGLSARVNGVKRRLGNLVDARALGDLPVTLVDVTEFSKAGVDRHFVAGTSPALISLLSQGSLISEAFQEDSSGRAGLLPGTVLTVQKATQVILSPNLLAPE